MLGWGVQPGASASGGNQTLGLARQHVETVALMRLGQSEPGDPMHVIEATIRAAFPEHPVPGILPRITEKFADDIGEALAFRVNARTWPSVSILDWRYVASPAICRTYMPPMTFAYYVPSFLVGVLSEPEWLYWALEAIIPFNKEHKPRGEWWFSFAEAFTGPQRAALHAFLAYQRDATTPLSLQDEELIRAAETIWA